MAKLTYAAIASLDLYVEDEEVRDHYAGTRRTAEFDPEAVLRLNESSRAEIAVGRAELAGQAIGARLFDASHVTRTGVNPC